MDRVFAKLKAAVQRRWTEVAMDRKMSASTASNSGWPSEEELVFDEMDLMLREEINRLEQGLTDYLQSQILGRINSDVEDRYVTRILELYERWALLEPPECLLASSSSSDRSEECASRVESKLQELHRRRKAVERQIAKRKASWKKLPAKQGIVEFEEGRLLGHGFRPEEPREFRYTLIVVHRRC